MERENLEFRKQFKDQNNTNYHLTNECETARNRVDTIEMRCLTQKKAWLITTVVEEKTKVKEIRS